MERLPAAAVDTCLDVPSLAPACPTKAPAGDERPRFYDGHFDGTWGFVVRVGDPEARLEDAPPEAVELHAFVGPEVAKPVSNLRRARNFERPTIRRGRPWVLDDDVEWAGRSGTVVLWPERPGETFSDHVSFDWTDGATTYRVSLKAWMPLEESVATLREVVRSIGQPPGRA